MPERPYTVIFSAGTSILGGLKKAGLALQKGHELACVTKSWLAGTGATRADLSAELSAMRALECNADDQAVLLTTTSAPGPLAAQLLAKVATLTVGITPTIHTIEDLRLDDADRFRRSGLPAFVTQLDKVVNESLNAGREPIVSVGSGVKVVLPYLALYGMLRRVSCIYVYETGRQLLWLPRLPLSFDYEALRAVARVLENVEEDTAVQLDDLQRRLGDDYATLEGLFEIIGNEATLSALGLLLLQDLRTETNGVVKLSPRAQQALDDADGIAAAQFGFMLGRLRSPLWRAHKRHSFARTDLDVYKPGNTAQRVAGWVEPGNTVFVAELYPTHDRYQTDLPKRKRADYAPGAFIAWVLPPSAEPLTATETDGERMTALARKEVARVKREVEQARAAQDEALSYSVELKGQLDQSKSERAAAVHAKEQLIDRLSSMSLLQRLRWILTGRQG